MRGDAAVDDAEHPAHNIGAAGEQKAQGKRDAQHPLAHRLLGKDLVDQQCRAFDHAPRTAARAEAAAFTAERDQVLGMTGAAANSKKTMLEASTLEVALELLLHISGQGVALRRQVRLERRVVFLDDLLEEGALRPMAHIRRRAPARTGFPASRQWLHARVPASVDSSAA